MTNTDDDIKVSDANGHAPAAVEIARQFVEPFTLRKPPLISDSLTTGRSTKHYVEKALRATLEVHPEVTIEAASLLNRHKSMLAA
jgi:hypothetical protein